MRENLRILQVVPHIGRGGAERLVFDITTELTSRPDVEVALLNFEGEHETPYDATDIRRALINARFMPSLFGKATDELNEYRKFVANLKPHVIHSHLYISEIITRQDVSKEIKYVSHLHDSMPQFQNFSWETLLCKARFTSFYEKRMLVRQYRKCDNHFIAISKSIHDYFSDCLPADFRKKITVMPNAINYKKFFSSPFRKIEQGKLKLVTAGNLGDNKNQAFLVDVVKVLKDRGIETHLDILGEGTNKEKIRQKAATLHLTDYVSLQGNVPSVEEYYRKAHIYVHAAIREGFGLSQIEAMATGLPCVILDGGGNKEIIENGKNGYVVKMEDEKLFADRIEYLFKNPDEYELMSRYAVSFASGFDIREYVDNLLKYYKSL